MAHVVCLSFVVHAKADVCQRTALPAMQVTSSVDAGQANAEAGAMPQCAAVSGEESPKTSNMSPPASDQHSGRLPSAPQVSV